MKKIFRAAAAAFFPKTCASCGEIIPEEAWLCGDCRKGILRCDAATRCRGCGLPKKVCACKNRLFRFEGCVAPLINSEQVRNAMLRFKYGDYKTVAGFFAGQMADCIRKEYKGIGFDGICYVPMHPLKRFRRGYEPARMLAGALSELLGIPLKSGLLACVRYTGKPQHELDFEGRRANVKHLYRTTASVEGKTLLLVDDIKTSGFTLDECAKELLNAGASSVWCAAALMTYPKPKKEKV